MKRLLAAILLLIMISGMLFVDALAVPATPVQKVALRTGPNTRYAELFTLPKSTDIEALAYEDGNGITWVFVEFVYRNERYRGYTGTQRLDIHGTIDYPNFSYASCHAESKATVYAAPCADANVRGKLQQYEMVTFLDEEGDYDYIEYYDRSSDAPSRGYIHADNLCVEDAAGACMSEGCSVYASPSASSEKVGKVNASEMVGCIGIGDSYANILFYSAAEKRNLRGYVPVDKLRLAWD